MSEPVILKRTPPVWALVLMTGIFICGFVDRIIMNVLVEPVKAEFGISDARIGLLTGLAFAFLNVGLGLVIARYAERARRMTLVSIGTVLWSIATAACGLAGSFMHLLLARVSVGVGEAVGLPSISSVLSDYFPKEKRATVMSIFYLGTPIGAFLGFVVGGYIAQEYGWRATFWIASIPGLLLATIATLTLREPLRGRFDDLGDNTENVPPFTIVVKRMWERRSLRHLLTGSIVASMVGFGVNAFLAAFLIRQYGYSLAQAGLISGIIAALPAAVSMSCAGWLADRIGKRDARAYGLIPGVSLLLSAPLYIIAVTRTNPATAITFLGLATLFMYTYLGPTMGVFQNMMHPRMRATGYAFYSMLVSLIGAGLGPLMVGTLSDHYAPDETRAGLAEGLKYALAISSLVYLWAAAHYLAATRSLREEWEMPINA